MMYCFDSSAVVKRYAPETGSEWVKSLVAPESTLIYLGQIGIVEIAAALSRKVRTRELLQDEYEAALWLFLSDIRHEEYILTPLNDQIIELSVKLTRRHPLRGYDAVHLASALTLSAALQNAELPSLTFVAADTQLCVAAQREGLPTENPNDY